jgi:hypothetical protein
VGCSYPQDHVGHRHAGHLLASWQAATKELSTYDFIAGSKAYIVRSIAVIIHSTEKGSGSISTNVLRQKVPASRVFVKEVGHVVNETSNADQGTCLSLRLVYTPRVSDKGHVSTLVTHNSPS